MINIETVRALAEQHAANVTADIPTAHDRLTHIRLTRLAEEALAIVRALEDAPQSISNQGLPTHY